METVLITGISGLVGQQLCKTLQKQGFHVIGLSRTAELESSIPIYRWDLRNGNIDKEALQQADYIIHLAGANIGEKRWSAKRKQLIVDSRVESGRLILKHLKELKKKPKAFISASAIGYYGAISSDKIFIETDDSYPDFLGKTCSHWEASADAFSPLGIRIVKLRTGVVLTAKGGALSKMMMPTKMGLGSAIGSGKQYMPWIHIGDLCRIYLKAIEDAKMEGVYNAVAPSHNNNKELSQCLAQALGKAFWFPNVPAFIMKLVFGDMSDMILNGSRVSSKKLIDEGYQFLYPELKGALNHLFEK